MRHARRRANAATESNRHPERAGARPSENPDTTMNTANGETSVDELRRPERGVVDRVAGPGAQEDVVDHDEEGRDTADSVQTGDAAGVRGWRRDRDGGIGDRTWAGVKAGRLHV